MCFDFLYEFVWNTYDPKKNWAKYLITPIIVIARNMKQCRIIHLWEGVRSVSTCLYLCTEGTSSPTSYKQLSW